MLFRNQVLEHKTSGSRWRVLDMDTTGEGVWLFNLNDRLALPTWTDLQDVGNPNLFIEVARPEHTTKLKISSAAKKRRERAHTSILPLISSPDIYQASTRSAMVQARALELNCSPQTIYTYLRTWWRHGQNIQALTGLFHKCGNVEGDTAGRGRPSKYGTPIYQLTETDHATIKQTLLTVFLKEELMTLEDSFQKMLEVHYSYIDGEGRLILKLQGERPSIGQFRYQARKHLPLEQLLRARKGDSVFELEDRAVLGSLRHATYTIADVYEIDSTVADVVLVHEHDRSQIVGKPSLYMVRDRKSNLVVGFYAGFEESSWTAARQAILSISEDKKTLCQRYGVAYNPNDWPAHRVMPKEFVADRGSDMLSRESDKVAEGLEMTITNLPKRRADWKPHVECGFKQAQRAMRSTIPGYVPPENFGKRQSKDYGSEAAITLSQFRKTILEYIIKHNNSPMPGYELAPQYVLAGMQPIPLNIWHAEIRDRAGLLNAYPEEQVRLALLPQTPVVVTREGIRLGECFYSAPEALERGWFVAAGHGRFEVQASYDLRLVDTILIHDPNHPDQYFEAQLLDKCSHFRGLSHREVEALGFLASKIRHHGEDITRQRTSDFHQNIAPTVSAAKAEAKAASKGKSRSGKKADTRAAREDARRQERQEAFGPILPKAQAIPLAPVLSLATASTQEASTAPVPSNTQSKSRQEKYKELMNGRS